PPPPPPPPVRRTESAQAFDSPFSQADAMKLTAIADRAINAAKARLLALGLDPEDPSSEGEDPRFKLS
ncbi:MAG TPA: hypothetical protein VMT58_01480, partial [Candidatus Binataceae bacterium]|nr:hypothetical protein [Candidatus Binataceae bacterium]